MENKEGILMRGEVNVGSIEDEVEQPRMEVGDRGTGARPKDYKFRSEGRERKGRLSQDGAEHWNVGIGLDL